MKQSEALRIMHRHAKQMRATIPNPDEETRRAWEWEDARSEYMIDLYERREAAAEAAAREKEKDEITLTTEVNIK